MRRCSLKFHPKFVVLASIQLILSVEKGRADIETHYLGLVEIQTVWNRSVSVEVNTPLAKLDIGE